MAKVIKRKAGKTLKQQLDEILEQPAGKRMRNWKKFFGRVQFSEDAVAYQRKLRDEWH